MADGFACYTFEPKSGVPIRVLALDDTQRDDDPYDNGYGHVSLDKERHDWLFAELDRGQADGVLMIIAAPLPDRRREGALADELEHGGVRHAKTTSTPSSTRIPT